MFAPKFPYSEYLYQVQTGLLSERVIVHSGIKI